MIKNVEAHNINNSTKYIFCLMDDSIVEMAVFTHKNQTHFCVSTQVGCPVGCKHCAVTYSKIQYRRNLNFKELKSMINYALTQENSSYEKVLSFSGHGEPMLNWNVVNDISLSFLNEFGCFYVTTIGKRDIIKQIINNEIVNFTYYISLHGPTDEIRELVIPNSRRYSTIVELIEFIRTYSSRGGKIVINYMLHQDNSSQSNLDKLINILKRTNQYVSLRFTDYNPIKYKAGILGLVPLETEQVLSYIKTQRLPDDQWCYRYSRLEGSDIQIACGQLRAGILDKGE